jgi:hypothetical protein
VKVARSRSLILLCVHPRSFACRSSPAALIALWSAPRRKLACTSPRRAHGSRRLSEQLGGHPHRGALSRGFRRIPPRVRSRTQSYITLDRPTAFRGAFDTDPSISRARAAARASNASQSFAYRDFRGAFAGRPSATHTRASSGCLIAPHLDGSNILSWRLRRRPFSQAGMCGVLLQTPPTPRATESA